MMWLKQLWMRHKMCGDLTEEIRQHLDESIEALMKKGLNRKEAEQTARRNFGNVTGIEERGRDAWVYPFIESLWGDLKYALRQLRKNPVYAASTIFILALGIGATAAVFSLVNAVLLRPLPFPQPDQLMWISPQDHSVPGIASGSLSYPDYFDWRAQNHTLSGLASYVGGSATWQSKGDSRRVDLQTVSGNFFDVLGVMPMAGRDFSKADEKPGTRVVMLSYAFWQSELGSARDVAGSTIRLDGHSYTVAGVMPNGFQFPIGNPAPALWTASGDVANDPDSAIQQRGFDILAVIGRLKAAVTQDEAKADLSLVAKNLARQYPDTNKQDYSALVIPEMENLTGDIKPAMRLLFGAVSLILVLVCANVAGLLVARGSARSGEFAVRTAMGAGRTAVVRQVMVESMTLFICGGAAGLALAAALVHATVKLMPVQIPRIRTATLDSHVLLFVLTVSALTGLVFGAFPAWRMARSTPHMNLRQRTHSGSGGPGRNTLHSALVVAQTAIGMVLLVGSGLMLRSFVHILNVDPGFDPKHVFTCRIGASFEFYKHDQHFLLYRRVLDRISALPGVQAASAGWPMPMSNNNATISFNIAGQPIARGDEPSEWMSIVMPGYFRTMRIPLIAGRAFDERDGLKGQPAIVINQAFAGKYFQGQNPIGQHIQVRLGDDVFKESVREVVGVVGNVKAKGLTAHAEPQYYLPFAQAVVTNPYVVIRSDEPSAAMQRAVASAVHEIDSSVPVYNTSPMEQYISGSEAQPRFQAFLLTCFAGIGLVLAAIGLYGLLSYTVVQRRFEIGLRIALGAQRSDVLRMIVRRGLMLALAGTGIGLAVSAIVTRFISGLLFQTQPIDPLIYAMTAALFLLVSFAATSLPAYRASLLDPTQTLREN